MTGAALLLSLALAGRAAEAAGARREAMRRLWETGRFQEAADAAQDVLKEEPRDAEASRLVDSAVQVLRRPAVEALRARAVEAYQAGRPEKADALYEELLELAPRDHQSLRDLMWLRSRAGRHAAARDAARRLEALRPGDREAAEVALAAALGEDRLLESARLARKMSERLPLSSAPLDLLGKIQLRLDDFEGARRSFSRSLRLSPGKRAATLGLGRALVNLREFGQAKALLLPLEGLSHQDPALHPLLARSFYWLGDAREALPRWRRAVEAYPEKPDYRYQLALTLAKTGARAEARRLTTLLASAGHGPSLNYLIDDSLVHGEPEAAAALLESRADPSRPRDRGLVMRLVELHAAAGRRDKAASLLDAVLRASPGYHGAWLMKGWHALEAGRMGESERAARRAVETNPDNSEGHFLLAELALRRGRRADAERHAARALALNPTSPPDSFRYARFLYASGRRKDAKAFVQAWSNRNTGPVLPILLYHGLTHDPRDPMLAYRYHHTVSAYEGHLQALKDAGYSSITTEQARAWLQDGAALPPKPVLITFDDGRSDSFALGDPALERLGFKAAMMLALVNTEGRPTPPPGSASWGQLARRRDSGRWELQSHGDLAHIFIPTSADGDKALFLVGRRWLPEAGRSETAGERRARVEADLVSGREKIRARLGTTPTAYAFPEGAFGQKDDFGNAPGAAAENLRLVGKHYAMAYVQDQRGLNTRGRDPLRLTRLEPPGSWSGPRLLRHFADMSPPAEAVKLRIEWAVEEGRRDEAYRWLGELERLGVSAQTRLAQEARIQLYAGDEALGRDYARRALGAEPDPGLASALERLAPQEGFSWEPGYFFLGDSDRRRTWELGHTLRLPRAGRARWRLRHRRVEAVEPGAVAVGDGAGAGVDWLLTPDHTLAADAGRDFMAGAAPPANHAQARLSSRWSDTLSSSLGGGRLPLPNARARLAGIASRSVDAGLRWRDGDALQLGGTLTLASYTDGNGRLTGGVETRRELGPAGPLDVSLVHRSSYDSTRETRAEYWSPRALWMHGVGPQALYPVTPRARLLLRYLPSLVRERSVPWRLGHEAEAALDWRWGRGNSVRPSYTRFQTASYHADLWRVELALALP
jgi:tetratricopeptide (TPR) repeat protein